MTDAFKQGVSNVACRTVETVGAFLAVVWTVETEAPTEVVIVSALDTTSAITASTGYSVTGNTCTPTQKGAVVAGTLQGLGVVELSSQAGDGFAGGSTVCQQKPGIAGDADGRITRLALSTSGHCAVGR